MHWTSGRPSVVYRYIMPRWDSARLWDSTLPGTPPRASCAARAGHERFHPAPHRATAELAPSRRESGPLFRRD
jgi:hypothetical protein